ncbi:McrC family protein [Streptomyces tsukubensis]|uniref:McrC family protein n=1 Tax=Streptomyces tsukubensis TaxID=83656 RepID=UPI00368E3C30
MTADLSLVEYGPARKYRLPDGIGRTLSALKILEEAAPDAHEPGMWRLRAGNKVGVVSLTAPGCDPVTIRITPKVPVGRLLFLLGYSTDPHGWREDTVDLGEHTELLPALAHAVERRTGQALSQGLLQGYRTTEETAFVLRGRVRVADQIKRRFGTPLPVEVAYDDFTTDIAENRILRGAVECLLRLPRVPLKVRKRLMRRRAQLADVTPLVRGQALPPWQPTRLNLRYHRSLHLAELVLSGASVEHLPGGVGTNGFIFDMNRVYEDFVCGALREALRPHGGRISLQARDIHLDERDAVQLKPDFVWYHDSGVPLAVADAKYKNGMRHGYPNEDLYQMLAYCTAFGLTEGHLVYARGSATPTSHRVRHSGILLHQHALELDQEPASLLNEMEKLAGRMLAGGKRR